MSGALDILLVSLALAVAALYLGRLLYRRLTGRARSCGSCGTKDAAKPTTLTIAGRKL